MGKRRKSKAKRKAQHDEMAARFPKSARKGDALSGFGGPLIGPPKQGGKVNPR